MNSISLNWYNLVENNQFNSNLKPFQVNLIFDFPQNQIDDDSIKLYSLLTKAMLEGILLH